jgi:hypothetical protein
MWSLAYHRPCKVLCGIRIFLVVSHLLFVHNNERGTKLTSRAVKVKYGHRDTKRFNIDLLVELSIPARVTIFLFFYPKNTRATCQKQIRPKRISLYTFSSKIYPFSIYPISVYIGTPMNRPKASTITLISRASWGTDRCTKLSSDPMFK